MRFPTAKARDLVHFDIGSRTVPLRIRRPSLAAWISLLTILLGPAVAQAGVVVLTNRANCSVAGQVTAADGKPAPFQLEPGDTLPLPADGAIQVAFVSGGQKQQYSLAPDAIYYFAGTQSKLQFAQLALEATQPAEPKPPAALAAQPVQSPRDSNVESRGSAVIPVRLLVDDDEPAVERIWEQRLRGRLAKASQVFDRLFHVRFEAVAVGTWDSEDTVNDFSRSLREFESETTPAPAILAIGFTSQYPADQFSRHLGGTRGLLYPYILIREWSQQITETERLEILVHELGHFLGAVHSSDANSAMRPKMTDRRARARSFQIRFDPLNALAIALVAEEFRQRGVKRAEQFPPALQVKLRSVYAMAAGLLPEDQAGVAYVALFDRLLGRTPQPAPPPEPLVTGTRTVVQAITAAARENDVLLRRRAAGMVKGPPPLSGDRLTELLVRQAAVAAKALPADVAPQAFLLGLGIGLDDSSLLRSNPVVGRLGMQAESDEERQERLSVLREPTMRGRRDLAQHFVVSAALAVLVGPEAAEAIGALKEVRDAQGGSGFSFVDLTADLAGVALAGRVRQGDLALEKLALSFTVEDFLPGAEGLREGLDWATFSSAFGSTDNDRFQREVTAIRQRIAALPSYRKP